MGNTPSPDGVNERRFSFGRQLSASTNTRQSSTSSTSSSMSSPSSSSRFCKNLARQRFYNAHHTWNDNIRDGSNNDSMFEFIRNCDTNKMMEKNISIFYMLIDKLLFQHQTNPNHRRNHNQNHSHSANHKSSSHRSEERIRNKKTIRSMRLIHAWMTLAINHDKYWIFCELGLILKTMYDSNLKRMHDHNNFNRIVIDYERIMGDLLCLCTLKKRFFMIKYMVQVLHIDVNLTCEGGETPLIICAEHNLPNITLFLLSSGADANCNNYLLSDCSNSPAQISASWQHLKVLYYLIIYGAKTKYLNIHLRSVEQYAKDNHLINYIVQKALNKRIVRNRKIERMLYKLLLHPVEYRYHFEDDNAKKEGVTEYVCCCSSESLSQEIDFEFPAEENMINFNINNQIKQNINKSIKFMERVHRKQHSQQQLQVQQQKQEEKEDEVIVRYHENEENVYLIKDIVSIIYSMIVLCE